MTGWHKTTCWKCRVESQITTEMFTALQQSGNRFYCPWGHAGVFNAADTEADKLRRERDRLKQATARLEDEKRTAWATATQQRERADAAERRASAARGQVTKLKNRAAGGACPCCNRTFENLHRHMASKHPNFATEAAPEGATVQ